MRLNPHCALLCPASLHLVTQEGPDGLGARFDALRMGGNCKSQPLANIGQVIFCIQSSNLGVIKPWSSFGLHDCDQNTQSWPEYTGGLGGSSAVMSYWPLTATVGHWCSYRSSQAGFVGSLEALFCLNRCGNPNEAAKLVHLHHEKPAV